MTRPEERLAALFAQDLPPKRDPEFQAQVLDRLSRRRLWAELSQLAVVSLAGAGLLWLLGPSMNAVVAVVAAMGGGLIPGGACMVVALSVLAFTREGGLGSRS